MGDTNIARNGRSVRYGGVPGDRRQQRAVRDRAPRTAVVSILAVGIRCVPVSAPAQPVRIERAGSNNRSCRDEQLRESRQA